jgi:hypothetical protein
MAKARITSKKAKAAKKPAPKKRTKAQRVAAAHRVVRASIKKRNAKPKKRATTALVRKATNAGKAAPEKESGYLAESGAAADQSYLGPKSDFPSTTGPGETLAETEETRDYVAALTKKAPESVAQGTDADADPEFEGACKKLGLTAEDGPIGREMAIGLASIAPKAPEGAAPIPTSDDEATADDHEDPDPESEAADATDDHAP